MTTYLIAQDGSPTYNFDTETDQYKVDADYSKDVIEHKIIRGGAKTYDNGWNARRWIISGKLVYDSNSPHTVVEKIGLLETILNDADALKFYCSNLFSSYVLVNNGGLSISPLTNASVDAAVAFTIPLVEEE